MTLNDVLGIVVGEPSPTFGILPDERLERQIETDCGHRLHQGRAALRIAEYQHLLRSHRKTRAPSITAEVDARKNHNALRLQK